MRRILQQARLSTLPQSVGLCQEDRPSIAEIVNLCTQRLIYAGGDSGWWGGWSKVVFQASRTNPYITLPAQYARAINMDVCRFPIRIQNEFYEEIEAGIGLRPATNCSDWCGALEGYERGVFSTMVDLPTGNNSYLRVYPANPVDVGRRILFSGAKDQNGNGIYSQNGDQPVNGFFLTVNVPFATTSFIVSDWYQIAKDVTQGDLILKAVDATTGVETALSRYLPWETNPAYRRYYINRMPVSCCNPPGSAITPGIVNITAMCKYEFIPVLNDTDPLIIGNLPALEEEAQAVRYSRMDTASSAGLEAKHHAKAITLLQQEMGHYLGKKQPAINYAPFGTARLERAGIGNLW